MEKIASITKNITKKKVSQLNITSIYYFIKSFERETRHVFFVLKTHFV